MDEARQAEKVLVKKHRPENSSPRPFVRIKDLNNVSQRPNPEGLGLRVKEPTSPS